MSRKPAAPPRVPASMQNFGLLASPPPLAVVVARCFVTCALAMRVQLDTHDDASAVRDLVGSAQVWLDTHGFSGVMDEAEVSVLNAAPGTLTPSKRERYAALGEAAAVLGWALRRMPLPAPHLSSEAADAAAALGFLTDEGASLATRARLRDREEVARYADIACALHWRIQRQLTEPGALLMGRWRGDQLAWPEDVTPACFVNDDLAHGEESIASLSDTRLLHWLQPAAERHRAALWLLGQQRDYWQVAAQVS